MKKILSILGAVGLTATTTKSIVSCENQLSEEEKVFINSMLVNTLFVNSNLDNWEKCHNNEIKEYGPELKTRIENKINKNKLVDTILQDKYSYNVVNSAISEYQKIADNLDIKLEDNTWDFTNVTIKDNKKNEKSKFIIYCSNKKYNIDLDLLLEYNSKKYNYKWNL